MVVWPHWARGGGGACAGLSQDVGCRPWAAPGCAAGQQHGHSPRVLFGCQCLSVSVLWLVISTVLRFRMGGEELRIGVILNPFCLCLPKEPMLILRKLKKYVT